MSLTENLLKIHGFAAYQGDFLTIQQQQDLYDKLKIETPWRHEAITIFGRKVMQPRLVAWYADPGLSYTYSQLTLKPEPWTSELLHMKERVEKAVGHNFNSVLLNYYRDGHDSQGWHSDDEKELGDEPVIASISLGATRDFVFRRKKRETEKVKIPLVGGSLLLMSGLSQSHWQHALPKRKRVHAGRINLTFRRILPQI